MRTNFGDTTAKIFREHSDSLAALKALLNIHVNLFERPDNNKKPFLVKVLQSKGALKKMVVEYIQQDQQLINLASECLGPNSELQTLFVKFKDHLDHYGAHLVKKDNPLLLLSIARNLLITWREIINFENPSDKRGEECAKMYLSLNECLQVFEQECTPYDSFDEMHKIIIKMKENSMEARRGFFNSSFLHEKSLKLITEFEYELLGSKKSAFDKSIHQIKEAREQDRSDFNKKIENLEAETAQAKTETAQAKTEAAQERAKNAEMRINQAQMEAEINALRKQIGAHTFFQKQNLIPSHLPDQTEEHEELFASNHQRIY